MVLTKNGRMNPWGPDGIIHGGPVSPLLQIRLGFGVHLVCHSGGSRGVTPAPTSTPNFCAAPLPRCPQMVAWRPIWWQNLVRPGVPGESGPRQSGMFWTSGSVESLPNGDSPQELQTSRDAASTAPRAFRFRLCLYRFRKALNFQVQAGGVESFSLD